VPFAPLTTADAEQLARRLRPAGEPTGEAAR